MPNNDWSQFIPGLVSGVILLLAAGIWAYISKGFRDYWKKVIVLLESGAAWLINVWQYLLIGLIPISFLALVHFGSKNNLFTFLVFLGYVISAATFLLGVTINNWNKANKTKTFHPIYIPKEIGNSNIQSRYIEPPTGVIYAEGKIGFRLQEDKLIFDTNEHIQNFHLKEDGSREISFPLLNPENHINSVYVLINSGNSKNIYKNKKIGEIVLEFHDAPPIVTELNLGYNVREWAPGNPGEFVREASSPLLRNFWTGMNKDGANALIDYLKIPVFECMKGNALKQIKFIHTPTKLAPEDMDAHYSVFGLTLEVEK